MKKMKMMIALALSLVMLTGMTTAPEPQPHFVDSSATAWYSPYVSMLVEVDVINGYPDDTFRGTNNVKRGEFAKMLSVVAMADPDRFKSVNFTDVQSKDWYAGYVAWAAETGITTGKTANTFAPEEYITRQEMTTMLYRFATAYDIELPEGETQDFADQKDIAKYARAGVRAMQAAGVINGYKTTGGYEFRPDNHANRYETAKMVCIFFGEIMGSERYKAYNTLKQDMTEHATDKTEDGYPMFEMPMDPDPSFDNIYRLYLSTESGVEQIYMEITQKGEVDIDDQTTKEITQTTTVAVGALSDQYTFINAASMDDLPPQTLVFGGKISELGPEHSSTLISHSNLLPDALEMIQDKAILAELGLSAAKMAMEMAAITDTIGGEALGQGYMTGFGFNFDFILDPAL